jgi:hypothetical protein
MPISCNGSRGWMLEGLIGRWKIGRWKIGSWKLDIGFLILTTHYTLLNSQVLAIRFTFDYYSRF